MTHLPNLDELFSDAACQVHVLFVDGFDEDDVSLVKTHSGTGPVRSGPTRPTVGVLGREETLVQSSVQLQELLLVRKREAQAGRVEALTVDCALGILEAVFGVGSKGDYVFHVDFPEKPGKLVFVVVTPESEYTKDQNHASTCDADDENFPVCE